MSVEQQDADGVWRQAIPLPFYETGIFRKRYVCCDCKTKFATEQAYRNHYRSDHALASLTGQEQPEDRVHRTVAPDGYDGEAF